LPHFHLSRLLHVTIAGYIQNNYLFIENFRSQRTDTTAMHSHAAQTEKILHFVQLQKCQHTNTNFGRYWTLPP